MNAINIFNFVSIHGGFVKYMFNVTCSSLTCLLVDLLVFVKQCLAGRKGRSYDVNYIDIDLLICWFVELLELVVDLFDSLVSVQQYLAGRKCRCYDVNCIDVDLLTF